MFILETITILLTFTIISTMIATIIRFLYYKYSAKQILKRKIYYEDEILNFLFKNKDLVLSQESKIDKIFIEQGIKIINNFSGVLRKKLSQKFDSLGVSDFLYKKYLNTRQYSEKEYLLYQIGELRSLKYLNELLNLDHHKLISQKIHRGYFFALNAITNEWIYELEKDKISIYIDKIIEIIEIIEKNHVISLKRLIEVLMNDTEQLFNYFMNHEDVLNNFISKILKSDISKKSKGEIFYILSVNKIYQIAPILSEELEKSSDFETNNDEELEYLILLIKSCGELSSEETNKWIVSAALKGKWILKSISAKYLYTNPTLSNLELLFNMLFDKIWWVRYNSARSLDKLKGLGFPYLIKALESNDKFAKDIVSIFITNGNVYELLIKDLKNFDKNSDFSQLGLIINSSSNKGIVDKLIREPDISEEVKIEIIKLIKNNDFIEYFQNELMFIHKNPVFSPYAKEKTLELLALKESAHATTY